jgi:hypothetical protein
MAMTDTPSREAQEIEELLPWYEKGTLGPAEMRRVSDYLQAHPEMRFRLSLIREELAETIAANESLGMPSSAAREQLFAAIAAEAAAAPRATAGVNVWWRNLLPEGVSPRLGLLAVAASVVIAVQAAALIVFYFAQPEDSYHLAAGRETVPAQPGSYVLVRFTDDAKAADITALLKELNAVVVDGPKPGGVFKLRVAARALTEEEREMTIRKLREKTDIISFVAPGDS